MTTLEQRHYVATDADMESSVVTLAAAITSADTERNVYLKALIGTTRDKLGLPPRERSGKPAKLSDEDTEKQLEALKSVHERLYAVVTRKWSELIPRGKGHATILNKRTNYARTNYSVLRRWVAAGKDIGAIAPAKATKRDFVLQTGQKRSRAVSPTVLRKRVERQATELVKAVLALGEADKATATSELELLVGQLTQQLIELTGKPTTDLQLAAEQHRPFKAKGSSVVFMPTQSQVIRQTSNPS